MKVQPRSVISERRSGRPVRSEVACALACSVMVMVPLAAPPIVTVPAPLTLSLPFDRYVFSASGAPVRLTPPVTDAIVRPV